MSKNDLIKTIQAEIQRLNQDIDLRIIRGLSYRREARRHKLLTIQLSRLTHKSALGWLSRMSRAMAMFFF